MPIAMLRANAICYSCEVSTRSVFYVLVWTNLMVFIDRGIIPGSTIEFNAFIIDNTGYGKPDILLGLLQSSFIIGYVAGSLLFGHLASFYGPFQLVTTGLSIWTMSLFVSGLAYAAKSYVLLLLARIVSGFGEASLQCNIPPWLTKAASPGKAAGWLGLFYTAISVGTALGYVYSASISATIGWSFAFILLAISFLPVLLFISSLSSNLNADQSSVSPGRHPSSSLAYNAIHHPTVLEELWSVLNSPVYLCLCFVNAAQSAVLIGLSTFGSAFVLGLGYYDTEAAASAIFGLLISLAGIVATPAGGYLVDKLTGAANSVNISSERKKVEQVNNICAITYWLMLASSILYCCAFFALEKVLFLSLLTIASALTFATSAGVVLAQISSVEARFESFSLAVASFIQHALGDVPSPIIAGYLKDYLAPACVSNNGTSSSSDISSSVSPAASQACRAQGDGLRMTMFLLSVWLFWAVLWCGVAWYLATTHCSEQLSGRPDDKTLLLATMQRSISQRVATEEDGE